MGQTAYATPLQIRQASAWQPSALDDDAVDLLYADAAAPRRADHGYVQAAIDLHPVDLHPVPDDTDPLFAPQATPRRQLPEPQEWLRQLSSAILECMSGVRPTNQVARWMTPRLHDRICRLNVIARRRGVTPVRCAVIRRVHICEPDDGIVEASVVVQYEGRIRAMAVRMIGMDGRWMVTALELG
ncbi:Rv3235 family protein [Rudaeicoccus suwonensis]|uniref:3-hydroxyacyl-CoA dehydrogenase n=1 Tax=Rudaeicoccus suwonensis TaxID=657409 RepID=A0A561E9B7_9MICO|nr:Rv3235 family protein [Rudaeicoccus suwonensis]TWE12160.1 hypothetical protein BKA23_0956 [Rudaeicoccus suwonensis]